jgi:hypothetical protein
MCKLQAENEALKSERHDAHCNCNHQKYKRHEKGSGCSCVGIKDRVLARQLQIENEQLKAKILAVKKGVIPMPDFDSIEANKATAFLGFNIDTPEKAYYYGWASCELEYGELLSKP